MAQKISRKDLKHDEFVDTAVDFGHWVETHWQSVLKWVGVGALVVVVALGWAANRRSGREAAKVLLARAVQQYEQVEAEGFGSQEKLQKVLEAADKAIGRGGNSNPGLLAKFYRGAALMHMNRLPESIEQLEEVVDRADGTLLATAHPMLAEAYATHGRTDDAIQLLNGLLSEAAPVTPTDQTLLQLGVLLRSAGRLDEAREQWQRIVDDFPTSGAAADARQLLDS